MSDKNRLLKIVNKYKNCNVLEIGVAQGNTSKLLLNSKSDLTYTGVDPWHWSKEIMEPPHNLKSLKCQEDVDKWYEQVLEKIKPFGTRAKVLRGFSKDVIPKIKETFHVIHVDGDHTYEGCKTDCDLVLALLKPGGTIVVDDVNYWEGCTKAWKEFKSENPNIKIIP